MVVRAGRVCCHTCSISVGYYTADGQSILSFFKRSDLPDLWHEGRGLVG